MKPHESYRGNVEISAGPITEIRSVRYYLPWAGCCLLSCLSETLPIHERSPSTFSGTVASVLTYGLRNVVTTPRPAGSYTDTHESRRAHRM